MARSSPRSRRRSRGFADRVVLFEPVRGLFLWLFKEIKPHGILFGYALTLLHYVADAHKTVLRNFAPRNRVFMQLGRKRTSKTQEQ